MINKKFNLKQLLIKYPYLTIGFFITVFFIVCAIYLPIQFEENDDITMLLLASGKYSGTPEPHLIYINYVYGLLVCGLYWITREIEWYSILFSLFHIISITVIIRQLLSVIEHIILRLSVIVFLLFFEALFIVNFQFTTTATLLTLSGIILLLLSKLKWEHIGGVVLIVTGALIRLESGLMVILLSMPLFVFSEYVSKKRLFLLISAVVVLFTCVIINSASYKYSSWDYFNRFRETKAKIIDNPNTYAFFYMIKDKNRADDFLLFVNSLFETNIMSNSKLENYSKLINEKTFKEQFIETIEVFKSLIIGNLNKYLPPLLYIMYVIVILFLMKFEFKNYITLLLLYALAIVIVCYIPVFRTLKYRAFASILLIMIVYLFCFLKTRNILLVSVSVVVLFLFTTYLCRMINNSILFNKKKNREFIHEEKLLNKVNYKIVPYGGSFLTECYNPFHVSEQWNKNVFSLALVGSPLNKNICNTYLDYVNGSVLFMDNLSLQSIPKMLKESIGRNYNVNVTYRVVIQDSSNAIVQFYK